MKCWRRLRPSSVNRPYFDAIRRISNTPRLKARTYSGPFFSRRAPMGNHSAQDFGSVNLFSVSDFTIYLRIRPTVSLLGSVTRLKMGLSRRMRPGDETLSNTDLTEVCSTPTPMVIGPDGKPITMADLPPPDTKRWVVRRKAVVVFAVLSGLLSLEAACDRYSLSIEEFMSWQRLIESHGMRGLRTTRLQQYRNSRTRRRL